jgi:two-component system chemotaxis response regulator CheV
VKKQDVLQVGSNEMELVDFRIFKKDGDKVYEGIYGVNVVKVREIIKIPNITEIPNVPEFVEGIFDLRGVVIPVINLAKWMGIEVPEDLDIKPRVLIAEFNGMLIGFIVHEAKRIRRISWEDIESASFSMGNGVLDKAQITGVTRIENDEVLLILDLETIMEELGIYQPNIDLEDGLIEQLGGLALIVDDSSTARKLMRDALDKMGMKPIEAKDGVNALEKLEELYNVYGDSITKELKIIISDVEMPQMDGFHFAAKLKDDERFKDIPLIFNSSISDHFSEIRGKEAGGEAYLTKFDAPEFYSEISRVVKSHINGKREA